MSLSPLPAGRFRIQDQGTWAAKTAVVDGWGLPSRALPELDLNRKGAVIPNPRKHPAFVGRADVLDRFHAGFRWQADDDATRAWIPQGLTGYADSRDDGDGRKWLAVSWHNAGDDVEKGMRLSLLDITGWGDLIRYRNVLLVNPIEAADAPSKHVTFTAIPAHAGGALWFRDYLYVADSRGFETARRVACWYST